MTPLNLVEAYYLTHTVAASTPGLARTGVKLRREILFEPGTKWYYEIDFTDARADGYVYPKIHYAYPPYNEIPGLAGALWRACAAGLDEALILHAHMERYALDYRAGEMGTPRCPTCAGTGTVQKTFNVVTGHGKTRVSTPETRAEKCPVCTGTGQRKYAPFSGDDFDAFRLRNT